jgi:hypothetical protein
LVLDYVEFCFEGLPDWEGSATHAGKHAARFRNLRECDPPGRSGTDAPMPPGPEMAMLSVHGSFYASWLKPYDID